MNVKVLVPIANGTEEIEAVCIIDTLRRAGAEVTVASVEDTLQVTASRHTKLVADTFIADCADVVYDCIAIPGGMPGAEHLRDCATLTAMLRAQRDAGRLYSAICAAPVVVLQHHGLLAGRAATCHPSFASHLENPTHVEKRVVVDNTAHGRCITSRGPGTAIEFALALIETLYGAEKAREIGGQMLAK
ncbi:MAG TPA: DJ-1/PfpI family protein [Anaerolineae bacterium]|nr:DJ-1/PfpI family protein [Anaerolineae bacterium]HQI86406.1 DJ-1/PfpI family protein [Anaerolineae bacterium]